MSFGTTKGCSSILDWEAAERHFARTPRPRERTRSDWDDYSRPLDDARKWHYRLEKGAGYYDVCLYRTVMARYYSPAGNERRVAYNYDFRTLSKEFMWYVVGSTRSGRRALQFVTADGRSVWAPVCSGGPNSGFGTELTLVDGRLDISRSRHRPIGTNVMSDEKRAWLKELRTHLVPFLNLMEYKVPDMLRGYAWPKKHIAYYPFGAVRRLDNPSGAFLRNYGLGSSTFAFTESTTQYLVRLYEESVTRILDVWEYNNNETLPTYEYVTRAAAQSFVRKLGNAYTGKMTKMKPLPNFPEDLPQSWVEA